MWLVGSRNFRLHNYTIEYVPELAENGFVGLGPPNAERRRMIRRDPHFWKRYASYLD